MKYKPLYLLGSIALILVLFIMLPKPAKTNQKQGQNVNKIATVVIDAGHGGKDPGALGKQGKEKDIALGVALKLGSYIEKNISDVEVIYTRKTDVFVDLYKRAEIANKAKAQLFISIHANSFTNPNTRGTETLVLGLHRTGENFDAAKRENSVILLEDDYSTKYADFDPNAVDSYIMFATLQNVYLHQSIEFGSYVQDQFKTRAQRVSRGVKQQGLLVLAQTTMPGVLIETGYITNRNEEKYLLSNEGQEIIASAIFRAFRDYKKKVESNSNYLQSVEPYKTLEVAEVDNHDNHEKPEEHNTVYKPEKKDQNIYYHVQLSSSYKKQDVSPDTFQGIEGVQIIKSDKIFKYVVGKHSDYSTVRNLCQELKSKYPDAFVIAEQGGQIIPLSQAIKK